MKETKLDKLEMALVMMIKNLYVDQNLKTKEDCYNYLIESVDWLLLGLHLIDRKFYDRRKYYRLLKNNKIIN